MLERGRNMKKPGFIITETIFTLVLAASVAAVAVLAVDLNTNQFGLDKYNPFVQSSETESKDNNGERDKQSSAQEQEDISVQENSKEQSSAQPSAQVNESESAEPSEEDSQTQPSKEDSAAESSSESSAESSAEASEDESGEIKLRTEPKDLKNDDAKLTELLTRYGYTSDFLNGSKVVVVDTTAANDRTKSLVYCLERSADTGYWWNIAGDGKPICTEAYIGSDGSDFDAYADSKTTPGGILSLREGFYIGEKPQTDYDMFEITDKTYWVTDPESEYYNTRVEGTDEKDWSKADHMITSDKSYKYGIVIGYNTEDPDSSKAAAVFMQCGSAATEGSIAVPEDIMKLILEWLDADTRAEIFITV